MWAGTDDNAGLNGHNIILEREEKEVVRGRAAAMQDLLRPWLWRPNPCTSPHFDL